MLNIDNKKTPALIISRQLSTYNFQHIFLSNNIQESCLISLQTREGGYTFPLYLYPENESDDLQKSIPNPDSGQNTTPSCGHPSSGGDLESGHLERIPNLNMEIVNQIAEKLGLTFTPEKDPTAFSGEKTPPSCGHPSSGGDQGHGAQEESPSSLKGCLKGGVDEDPTAFSGEEETTPSCGHPSSGVDQEQSAGQESPSSLKECLKGGVVEDPTAFSGEEKTPPSCGHPSSGGDQGHGAQEESPSSLKGCLKGGVDEDPTAFSGEEETTPSCGHPSSGVDQEQSAGQESPSSLKECLKGGVVEDPTAFSGEKTTPSCGHPSSGVDQEQSAGQESPSSLKGCLKGGGVEDPTAFSGEEETTPSCGHPSSGGDQEQSAGQESPSSLKGCLKGGGVENNNYYKIHDYIIYKKKIYNLPYNIKLKDRARELRKAGNLAEILFWKRVHKRIFWRIDFDRQKIIGNYIVDFYVKSLGLIVEIDGMSHDNKQEYDEQRDAFFKSLELEIFRITDKEVKNNLDNVMKDLENFIIDKYSNPTAFSGEEETTPSCGHPSSGGDQEQSAGQKSPSSLKACLKGGGVEDPTAFSGEEETTSSCRHPSSGGDQEQSAGQESLSSLKGCLKGGGVEDPTAFSGEETTPSCGHPSSGGDQEQSAGQ